MDSKTGTKDGIVPFGKSEFFTIPACQPYIEYTEEIRPYKAKTPTFNAVTDMLKFYGIDPDELVQCPACDEIRCIRALIPHLNNEGYDLVLIPGRVDYKQISNHSWTFKQMGKWLESLGH